VVNREFKRVGTEEGVGVQQDDIPALGECQGKVIGGAEAEVYLAAQDADMGKLGLYHVHGAVVRVVINNEDFDVEIALFAFDGLQRFAQHIAGIEGDDDERNIK
jgi:hypothetical protein